MNRILEEPGRVADFQVLCLPGGFSYGDDIAAGRILGNQIQHHLAETLAEFREAGKLIIGICNGFQILLKTNLLAAADAAGPTATLTSNDSGRFEARWVRLAIEPGKCVFLQGIREMELPVAHGEGKFMTRDAAVFDGMSSAGRLVMRYTANADSSTHSAFPIPNSAISLLRPLPCESEWRDGRRCRHLRRDRPRVWVDAASGAVRGLDAASTLDARTSARSGRRLASVSERGAILHVEARGWRGGL